MLKVTLLDRDVEDAVRILMRIAQAAHRRAILSGALDDDFGRAGNIDEDAREMLALQIFAGHKAAKSSPRGSRRSLRGTSFLRSIWPARRGFSTISARAMELAGSRVTTGAPTR